MNFSQKAGSMTPEQQQQFIEQKQKEMQDKQKELLDPIRTSIETQVQSVADSRGINVVLDKNNVLYGGQDITQEVLQKLQAEGDTTSSDATADTTTTDSTATTENSATTETSGEATNTAQ